MKDRSSYCSHQGQTQEYCTKCGKHIYSACRNCRARLDLVKDTYCSGCGARIKGEK